MHGYPEPCSGNMGYSERDKSTAHVKYVPIVSNMKKRNFVTYVTVDSEKSWFIFGIGVLNLKLPTYLMIHHPLNLDVLIQKLV